MRRLHLTLPNTAQNLALDEWLLEQVESGSGDEVLRLWENPSTAVIIGRSSKYVQEVNAGYCEQHGIIAYRRKSGGAAVVIGPGCLMYAVVLDVRSRPGLAMIDQAHQLVMSQMQTAISNLGIEVQFQGTCDLTLNGKKFSGNSLRCQRNSVLYHGTILLDFPLDRLHQCLGIPPRQPEYRQQREHRDFVTNLMLDRAALMESLNQVWQAEANYGTVDLERVDVLAERYADDQWTRAR